MQAIIYFYYIIYLIKVSFCEEFLKLPDRTFTCWVHFRSKWTVESFRKRFKVTQNNVGSIFIW